MADVIAEDALLQGGVSAGRVVLLAAEVAGHLPVESGLVWYTPGL